MIDDVLKMKRAAARMNSAVGSMERKLNSAQWELDGLLIDRLTADVEAAELAVECAWLAERASASWDAPAARDAILRAEEHLVAVRTALWNAGGGR